MPDCTIEAPIGENRSTTAAPMANASRRESDMTIVYASDKNYAALTAISAVSALKHNPGSQIVLLGYNLEQGSQDLVRSRVERFGGTFLYRDISPSIKRLVDEGYNGYTSYAAYARIFIPEILKEDGRSPILTASSFREKTTPPMEGRITPS